MIAFRTSEQREERMKQVPMHRHWTPEKVAQLVAFLLSDESSYITGAEIAIDGASSAEPRVMGCTARCAIERPAVSLSVRRSMLDMDRGRDRRMLDAAGMCSGAAPDGAAGQAACGSG